MHVLPISPPSPSQTGMHVDDLLNAREKINRAVLDDMKHVKEDWGIDVVSYEGALQQPHHPQTHASHSRHQLFSSKYCRQPRARQRHARTVRRRAAEARAHHRE